MKEILGNQSNFANEAGKKHIGFKNILKNEKGEGDLEALLVGGGFIAIVMGSIYGVVQVENHDYTAKMEAKTQILQEEGLLGEHSIIYFKKMSLLQDISIQDKKLRLEKEDVVQVAWKIKPGAMEETSVSIIPLEKINFLIMDDPNTESTITFNFDSFLDKNSLGLKIKNDTSKNRPVNITVSKKNYDDFKNSVPAIYAGK